MRGRRALCGWVRPISFLVLLFFFFFFVGFGRLGERGERSIPEAVEVVAHGFETSRLQAVDAARPDRGVDDEAGVLENTEVLRDRRTRDGELRGERADRRG